MKGESDVEIAFESGAQMITGGSIAVREPETFGAWIDKFGSERILLGADAVYIGTAALLALGCHLCRSCHSGKCNWGIATQRPDLVERLDPEAGTQRLVNLVNSWTHEIKEMMGGMGINSIEAARGNRLMLRGVGLTEAELRVLGVRHAGE